MAKKRSGKAKRSNPRGFSTAHSSRAGKADLPLVRSFSDVVGMTLIFCITLIAYLPSLQGKFLFDDLLHVTAPALQSLQGLWRIWSELGTTQQYYPFLHTAFWIEHWLWGDAVLGYHLINVILHSISAILVVLIVRRLRLPGAWLAGLIFALHPVCVESVAWISEQKNTLSAVFCLAAGLTYLRFDETRRKSHYFWAMGFFILALLSKSVTATLPVALLVVLWWRHGRLGWRRDLSPLLPWLGVGLFAGVFTSWVEKTYIGAQGADFSLTLLQRCLLAGRVVWFYLAKLVWPSNLTFIYPRFNIDANAWWQYAFPAGLLALLTGLWLLSPRRRGPLAGSLFFLATLFPVLGFWDISPFRYSYVADRFQYLACLGIIVPVAAGLAMAAEKSATSRLFSAFGARTNKKPFLEAAVCAILVLALTVLTWKQNGMYADAETLWRSTISRNPTSSMAFNNLGDILFRQGRADEALGYCRKAVTLEPNNPEANANLANVLRFKRQFEEAIVYYRKASELKPQIASFHGSIANTLIEIGKIEEAITQYETALQIDPTNGMLTNNLAWILATCPQASLRNGRRALELASQAVQLMGANDLTVVGTLAAAYAETGRFTEAVATEEKAHALALATGDSELAEWHAQLLNEYRMQQPNRDSSLNPN